MTIKRGGIFIATLNPVIGKEISKTRPVVVISNNINNKYSGTVTVLPLTSKKLDKIYPFEVLLSKGAGNLPKDSKLKADQIRTLDQSRLISKIGIIKEEDMEEVEKAVKIHLGFLV